MELANLHVLVANLTARLCGPIDFPQHLARTHQHVILWSKERAHLTLIQASKEITAAHLEGQRQTVWQRPVIRKSSAATTTSIDLCSATMTTGCGAGVAGDSDVQQLWRGLAARHAPPTPAKLDPMYS